MNPGIFGPGFSTQKDDNRPPIGSMEVFPDCGPTVSLANREIWLRTGVVAASATYPQLAKLEHARAHLFNTTVGNSEYGAVRIVCSPSGTYVATFGSSADVINTSTTGGATWTRPTLPLTSHNLKFGSESVVYANGMFVLVGQSYDPGSTVAQIFTSTNGVNWTSRYYNNAISDGANGLAAVCWTGTFFLACCQTTSSTSTVITSTDGVTWTPRSIAGINVAIGGTPASVSGTNGVGIVSSLGGNAAIVSNLGATTSMVATMPTAASKYFTAAGSNFILTAGNTSSMWITDSPSGTWTRVSPIAKTLSMNIKWSGVPDQPVFATATGRPYFAFTEDGVTWKTQYKVQPGNTNPGTSSANAICQGPNDLLIAEDAAGGQTVHIAPNSSVKASNSCGVAIYSTIPLFSSAVTLTHNDLAYYIRAK